MKSIEKLRKQREKYRKNIIEEFGNSILKLCSTEVLKQVRKDQKALAKKYVGGCGSFEMDFKVSRYDYRNRFRDVMNYFRTLEFIESVSEVIIAVDEETNIDTKIAVKFHFDIPKSETALGDRFHKIT